MPKEMKMRDAESPLALHVRSCDLDGAKQRDPRNCMIARAAKRALHVDDVVVHRNIAYFRFRGDAHYTRYQSTPATRIAVAAFDKTLQKAVKLGMVQLPGDELQVVLRPPRNAVSLKHLRSEKMKAIRAASAKRRKGQKRRAYKKPDSLTLEGVRTGQGYRL